jgi:hypothetical protein
MHDSAIGNRLYVQHKGLSHLQQLSAISPISNLQCSRQCTTGEASWACDEHNGGCCSSCRILPTPQDTLNVCRAAMCPHTTAERCTANTRQPTNTAGAADNVGAQCRIKQENPEPVHERYKRLAAACLAYSNSPAKDDQVGAGCVMVCRPAGVMLRQLRNAAG